MFQRCALFLMSVALLQTGCGRGAADKKSPSASVAAAGRAVTLHVEGMSKRLNLFWLDWPNKIQKALERLSGVASVEVSEADLENDTLHVHYDPAKLTDQDLLQTVKSEGFDAKIIPKWKWRS